MIQSKLKGVYLDLLLYYMNLIEIKKGNLYEYRFPFYIKNKFFYLQKSLKLFSLVLEPREEPIFQSAQAFVLFPNS